MRTSILSMALAVIACILCGGRSAGAQVIYSNFGPGDTWSANTSFGFGAFSQGMRFVPTVTATVTRVDAGMTLSGAPGITRMSIVTESPAGGGTPSGTVVWTGTIDVANGRAVYTFTGSGATLTAGTPYWALASTTLSFAGEWGRTSPAVAGTGGNNNSGAWQTFPFTAIAAFRVAGDNAPCCNTKTGGCTILNSSTCTTLGLRVLPVDSSCLPSTCRACATDFNNDNAVNVADIFAYIAAWFAGCP